MARVPRRNRQSTRFKQVSFNSPWDKNLCPLMILLGVVWLEQARAMEISRKTALTAVWSVGVFSHSALSLPVTQTPETGPYRMKSTEAPQSTTSSNQSTTSSNQSTTPSNQPTTPSNQSTSNNQSAPLPTQKAFNCNVGQLSKPVVTIILWATSLSSLQRTYPAIGVFTPDGCPVPGAVNIFPFVARDKGSSFADSYYPIDFNWYFQKNESRNSAVIGFQLNVACGDEQDNILVSKAVNWLSLAYDQAACNRRQSFGRYCIESQVVKKAIQRSTNVKCQVWIQPLPAGNVSSRGTAAAEIERTTRVFDLPSCRSLGCPKTTTTDKLFKIKKALCQCVPNPPGSITSLVALNLTSARVNWTAANDPLVAISGYCIVFLPMVNGVSLPLTKFVPGQRTQSTIFTGLQPGESYSVQVISVPVTSIFVPKDITQYSLHSRVLAKQPLVMPDKPGTGTTKASSSSSPSMFTMTLAGSSQSTTSETRNSLSTPASIPTKTSSNIVYLFLAILGGLLMLTSLVAIIMYRFSRSSKKGKFKLYSLFCKPSKPVQPENKQPEPTANEQLRPVEGNQPDPQPPLPPQLPPPEQDIISSAYISYSRYEAEITDRALVLAEQGYLATWGRVDFIIDQQHLNNMADNHFAWIERNAGKQLTEYRQFIVVVLSEKYPLILPDEARQIMKEMDDDFKKAEAEIRIFQSDTYHGREDFLIPVYFGSKPLPFQCPTIFRGKTIYYLRPPFDPLTNTEFRNFLSRLGWQLSC